MALSTEDSDEGLHRRFYPVYISPMSASGTLGLGTRHYNHSNNNNFNNRPLLQPAASCYSRVYP